MKSQVVQTDATKGSDTATPVKSYTPAPWEAFPSNVIRDSYGVEIAVVSPKSHFSENSANAKLIACAPELLAALEEIVENAVRHNSCEQRITNYSFQIAKALIAKAQTV